MTSERKKRSGVMLCYPFEEKRLAKWDPPYIVQPKLDGVRSRAVRLPDAGYVLFSSTEEVILSVPHITKALNELPFDKELDGELYIHGATFEQINSIVSRTVNLSPDHENVKFFIFDHVDETKPQAERTNWLYSQTFKRPLVRVPTFLENSLEGIMKKFNEFVALDYEGIIVRHALAPYKRARSTFVMKFKPKKDDWYKVVGYKEELDKHGSPKDRLGALICSGDDGTEFAVGSGLTDYHRQHYWENRDRLVGSLCHVQYQHVTPGKRVPRFPVFVSVE